MRAVYSALAVCEVCVCDIADLRDVFDCLSRFCASGVFEVCVCDTLCITQYSCKEKLTVLMYLSFSLHEYCVIQRVVLTLLMYLSFSFFYWSMHTKKKTKNEVIQEQGRFSR